MRRWMWGTLSVAGVLVIAGYGVLLWWSLQEAQRRDVALAVIGVGGPLVGALAGIGGASVAAIARTQRELQLRQLEAQMALYEAASEAVSGYSRSLVALRRNESVDIDGELQTGENFYWELTRNPLVAGDRELGMKLKPLMEQLKQTARLAREHDERSASDYPTGATTAFNNALRARSPVIYGTARLGETFSVESDPLELRD